MTVTVFEMIFRVVEGVLGATGTIAARRRDAYEKELYPTTFLDSTRKLYQTPFVSPLNVNSGTNSPVLIITQFPVDWSELIL